VVSRSRMIAKRVQGDIDEEAPTPQRKANGMSFCTLHVLCGQLRVVRIAVAYRVRARNSIATSLPIAREDHGRAE
jgi:hypothetical protein